MTQVFPNEQIDELTALTPWQRVCKRGFDLILASLLLIPACPILCVSALAIKLDSKGAVLYRQKRIGESRVPFTLFKLRTMIEDAERLEYNLIVFEAGAFQFRKYAGDPRVTRVGAFLRRWSIDELPQLFNILRGEMSLVGPRPELPALAEHYRAWQRTRFDVPQGITGLWQVNGRPQNIEQKVAMDLHYIHNYSLWRDLWIVLQTIPAVISRHGAL